MSKKNNTTGFTQKELAFAKELSNYENKWVAISTIGSRERVVGSGDRITDAKREADKSGVKNPAFRKVPPSGKVFIASGFRSR